MKDIVIHHDLVRNTNLAIPSSILEYKYVFVMTKTTSTRYSIIRDIISRAHNFTIEIEKKTWHIAGFADNIKDLKSLSTLSELTKGIKNVFIFRNGVLAELKTSFNKMVECALISSESLSKEAYCEKQETKTKQELASNGIVGIRISLEMFKNPTRFEKVDVVAQRFPCQHINNKLFNPFQYRNANYSIQEAYYTFILRNNKIVLDCPFFALDRYFCEFDEEIRQVQ